MEENSKNTSIVLPVLINQPHPFTVGKHRMCLYPQSLGVFHITAEIVRQIGLNADTFAHSPAIEAMRLVRKEPYKCAYIVAYHCEGGGKKKLTDIPHMNRLARKIQKAATERDLALLLLVVITSNRINEYMNVLGITEDKKQLRKVQEAKKSNNTFVFGGKSVYGSMIGAACEKYGWSFDYCVWGVSMDNLNLLLADSVTSIYLSDEEMKNACIAPQNSKPVDIIEFLSRVKGGSNGKV